jgi:putative transposase
MRKSKFSESQIVWILKEAEAGVPIPDLLRRHGISKTTFFEWRSKYAGASVSDVKRLRKLEGEHAKLKRMYAELALQNTAIKDVLARKWKRRPRNDRPRKMGLQAPVRRVVGLPDAAGIRFAVGRTRHIRLLCMTHGRSQGR